MTAEPRIRRRAQPRPEAASADAPRPHAGPRIRRRARRRPDTAPSGVSDLDTASRQAPGEAGDYEVGYAKPPKGAQFRPGRSGNPKGRPRGAKNLKTVIGREMSRKITIRDEVGRRTVSKREVVAMQLVKKALEGHDKAMLTLLKLDDELEAALKAAAAAQAATPEPLDETDRQILAEFAEHLLDSVLGGPLPLESDRADKAPEDKETDDET